MFDRFGQLRDTYCVMYPVLFEIGQFKFYSFGTFIALGTILAGIFLYQAARVKRLKTTHLFDAVLYTLLFSLIGARITYYAIYSNQFQTIWQAFYFWQGGLVALGGIVAGFLTYVYFLRRTNDPIWQMLDISAFALLIAWAVGKFGCFLSSCSIGRPTDSFLAINGTFPIDLFSVIWAILIGGTLYLVWRKNRLSDGVIFFLALEALFLGELLIKTLRLDFNENIARLEAMIYLALIIGIYVLFWRMHGPRFTKKGAATAFKNLVFRRRR